MLEGIYFIGGLLFDFTFYYPLFMSYLWMIGALFYYLRFERGSGDAQHPPRLGAYPGVAIVIPCHNEEDHVRDTIGTALAVDYPDFEVIAINDGSSDRTGELLDEMSRQNSRLRVIHQAKNQGKAVGLNTAALLTRHEYLVCIDGDALIEPHALHWMMMHFLSGPRVGSVTGNPRIRNRSTLLGRIQVGEFSSIIGLIKRAQRTYGRIFTVSGVIAGFRKTALHDAGYWSPTMLTEDIDISWKLQLNHWDIRYEPRALCWILMPETFRGLWRQRVRWSQGGTQVLMEYLPCLLSWRKRRMWAVYLEYFVSVAWAFFMFGAFLAIVIDAFVLDLASFLPVPSLMPGWTGVLIGSTCLLQIGVSLKLDKRYDHGLGRMFFWMIWYPLAYWILNVLTTVYAVPKTLLRDRHARAVWKSPDRGLSGSSKPA